MLSNKLKLAAAGNDASHWYATLTGDNVDSLRAVKTDSIGNIYITGSTKTHNFAEGYKLLIAKYDRDGELLWQRIQGQSGSEDVGMDISIDEKPLTALTVNVIGYSIDLKKAFIYRWNSNGQQSLPAGRIYDFTSTATGRFARSIDKEYFSIDSGYNTSVLFRGFTQADPAHWVLELDILVLTVKTTRDVNFIYVLGQKYNSEQDIYLLKYSSAGILQWQIRILNNTNTQTPDIPTALTVDDGDNVYVGGYFNQNNYEYWTLAKVSELGDMMWQKKMSKKTNIWNWEGAITSIDTDGNGNVYVCGIFFETQSYKESFILKFNAIGELQWQRQLYFINNPITTISRLVVDSRSNMYLVGDTKTYVTHPSNCFVAKLPTDGSLTGEYEKMGYIESNVVVEEGNLTVIAGDAIESDPAISVTDLTIGYDTALASLISYTETL